MTQIHTLVNIAAGFVVHLFRAVEHVHHDAQRSSQILSGLRLAGPGRPSGGTTHYQVETLMNEKKEDEIRQHN